MKNNLKTRKEASERTLDILFYAVRATKPFRISDLMIDAVNASKEQAFTTVKILIDLGYIEKATCITYQATSFAKQMFNVGDSDE